MKTWVYHGGSEDFRKGWYTEADYEYTQLDYENGQVMPPMSWWEKLPAYTEGARGWHGWGVDSKGYLTGKPANPELAVIIGGGRSKIAKGIILLGSGSKTQNALWTVYYGYKDFKDKAGNVGSYLYIGMAKGGVKARYSVNELSNFAIQAFNKLNDIPDSGTARGVEQAIMNLNGWAGKNANFTKPILSNTNAATVKEIYLKQGRNWLDKNIPTWQTDFKFQ